MTMQRTKPRLCFMATSPFSVNAFLKGHIESLADFDITVIAPAMDSLATIALPENARLHAVDIPREPSPWRDLCALLRIWRHLRAGKYLAVMTITPKAGLIGMLAARLAGVTNRFHCFTGQVWATKHGLPRWVFKTCDRFIVALGSRIFADGEAQRQFLVNQGVASPARIALLGPGPVCGIDMQRFRADADWRGAVRAEQNIAADATVALYLGRLHPEKGIRELLTAFGALVQTPAAGKLFLLCVGPSDDEQINQQLDDLEAGVRQRMRLVGGVHDPERYIAAADFLVLPSYREGFGMVVLEAASAALPAIVSDVYGLQDAVEENVTALKVPVRDAGRLADAMQLFVLQPEMVRQMGNAARERVAREFAADTVTAAWRELFQGLTGGN